ncbi:DUF4358 domain-containing protein [Hydrogenoanaerobacterium sp.]|uniref:DUF4358 domain-containing protein n=1 Tax=Hydrogenoanaerobacterium sp. TaxID=2953763 RepID=UPI00289EB1CA|nr:DUF4358 domain-containing protein [Hydrogenoanaerobacterium sp.]
MKKLLTLLIVATLAVSMVACTSNNDKSSSSESSSVSESVDSSSEEESSEEESTPEFEIPEENKKLGDIITAARTDEMNEAMNIIMSKDDPQAQLIFDVAGLNADDMEAFAVSISPMNIKAYGVAIIKPAEGKDEAVLKAINGFVDGQKKAFEQYLPDQKEIANSATVDTLEDGTVVLVMSEDGAAVQKAILEALKK